LHHATKNNGPNNSINLNALSGVLRTFKPDFVINQMPYEKKLTDRLAITKKELGYILLGCLRNSLFSYKNNIRNTSKLVLPTFIFKLLDNQLGLYLLLHLHRIKHKNQLKRILDRHDRFILLAPPNRNELAYFVGDYKKNKVDVVPNSIPEVYNGTLKKEKIILHVGRLNIQQKRSDLLLEFWMKAYDKLKDWQFIIVGDGPYKGVMEQKIKENNLPRIELLGYQKPEDWYKKASIFIMTSAYEGFPNVILEAQSFSCIPLAFESYDAISWIVHDKKDALLFEPYDTTKMANETINLAINKDRLKKMAEASKDNASQFVVDKVARIWMDLFENLKKEG